MKAVLYADASSRPNPGFGGYGVFGYLYQDAKRPKNTKHPTKAKLNFTDTGVLDTKSETPIEVIQILEYIRAINSPKTSNNEAELKAVLFSLERMHAMPDVTSVLIWTDSEYVVKSIESGLDKWTTNGFKRADGRPVAYIDDWLVIDLYRKALKDRGTELQVKWIKGHNNDYGNDTADLYAVIGGNASRCQIEQGVHDFQEDIYTNEPLYADYKKSYQKDFIYHFKDLFFSSAQINDPNYCFISSNDDELEIGKRDNTTIFLANHGHVPEFINRLKKIYREIYRPYTATCSIKLSRLENRDVLRLGEYVDARYLIAPIPKSTKRAYTIVGSATTSATVFMQENVMDFPFIASVTKVNELLNDPEAHLAHLRMWDVTETFVKDGKLVLSNKDKFVDFTYLTDGQLVLTQRLIVSVGSDLPSYLSLKKIESEIEKVEVILQASPNNNLHTLYIRITTGNRLMYSLNVVNKYLAVATRPSVSVKGI